MSLEKVNIYGNLIYKKGCDISDQWGKIDLINCAESLTIQL